MDDNEQFITLVKLSRAGDHEAYGEIYEKTVQDVYRTVRFLVRHASDAEDLVQEVYIQAYRSLEKFDVQRPFRPWLMGIAMRIVQNDRRKKLLRLRFNERVNKTDTAMEQDFTGELVSKLAHRPLLEQVQRLPYKQRQVITLHYLSEYTQEEIATILDIPLGTVKSRIHAGLGKLRQKKRILQFIEGRKVEDWG